MIEHPTPFDTSASDPERRRFLARLERALELRELLDVTWEYRPVAPMPGPWGFTCLGLVIRAARQPGEVQVVPVAIVQRIISTRPGGEGHDIVELKQLFDLVRAQLRNLGIAGLSAPERVYDPFPGEGVPTYEVTIWRDRAGDVGSPESALIDHRDAADPEAIVNLVAEWRDATRAQHPAEPRAAKSLAPLRALARARGELVAGLEVERIVELRRAGRLGESWRAAGLLADFNPERPRGAGLTLGAEAAGRLREDLAHLDPVELLRNVPRDDRGKLALGETVVLESYEHDPPLGPNKQVWLVARGPARRRDPQAYTLALAPLVGEYYTHRWDGARWLWDERARGAGRVERWGVDNLPLDRLGLDAWRTQLDGRLAAVADGVAERAAACILLQDAGRLVEAMALYDVEIDDEVRRRLNGEPLEYAWGRESEPWARAVQEGLRVAAPWRFEGLLRAAAAERAARATGKARRPKAPRLRLFWLPHQTTVSRGAIILTARDRDGGRPRLEIEWSASLTRLPQVAWQRSAEIDLRRFGLAE